jgi:cyclohexyl-isocyanide hydratase
VAEGRVVSDRNRITGGGVTAGIDFGLTLIAQIVGPEVAAGLQLLGEYDPQPPTPFGNPDRAPVEMVAAAQGQVQAMAPALTEFFATKNA